MAPPERVLTPLYNTAESETLSLPKYRENLRFYFHVVLEKNRVLNFAIWQSLDSLTVSFVIFHQIFDLPTVFQKNDIRAIQNERIFVMIPK